MAEKNKATAPNDATAVETKDVKDGGTQEKKEELKPQSSTPTQTPTEKVDIKKEEIKETDKDTEEAKPNMEKQIADGFKTRHVTIKANASYSTIISKNLPYEGDVTEILIKASLKAGHIVIETRDNDSYVLSLGPNNEIVETKAGKKEEEKTEEK